MPKMHHQHHIVHRDINNHHEMRASFQSSLAAAISTVADEKNSPGVATVYSVVYVTMPATFSGPTAALVTESSGLGSTTAKSQVTQTASADSADVAATTAASSAAASATSAASATPQTSAALKSSSATSRSTKASTSQDQTSKAQASQTSSIISSISQTSSSSTSAQSTTLITSSSQTVAKGTPVAQSAVTSSSSSSASATAAPSTGMSSGGKAGLAFGIILGLGLIAGLVVFALRRKRKQEDEGHQQIAEEKSSNRFSNHFASGSPGIKSSDVPASKAPRLSLRPVTQFLPGIGEPKVTEMTSATGGLNSFYPPVQKQSAWERRMSSADRATNPFGTHAETVNDAAAEKAAENAPIPVVTAAAESDPFADRNAGDHSRTPSDRSEQFQQSSPPKAEVGTAAAIPVGSPRIGQPNNVHRVQLDFKPSMDDELELIAGQVVRIVHEYDDGWALCMRMDRSKQGVAPRTCLSKLPLKPRPVGPPPQNGRPMGSGSPVLRNFSGSPRIANSSPRNSPPRDPMFPAPLSPSISGRPQSPVSPPKQGGRQRSHSHAQSDSSRPSMQTMSSSGTLPSQGHRRSVSANQFAFGISNGSGHSRRASPTSPPKGVPARKPVPGQAI